MARACACDDGRVVSNLICQALSGEDITIYGDGSQTRSFCYVDDMVEGLIRLMSSDRAVGMPVNLGNPNELSVKDLVDLVLAMTGSSSSVELSAVAGGRPSPPEARHRPRSRRCWTGGRRSISNRG